MLVQYVAAVTENTNNKSIYEKTQSEPSYRQQCLRGCDLVESAQHQMDSSAERSTLSVHYCPE